MPKRTLSDLDDDTPLRFGKYKGCTPNEVAKHDPGYIVWLHDNVPGAPISASLTKDCEIAKMESDAERDLEYGPTYDEFWKR